MKNYSAVDLFSSNSVQFLLLRPVVAMELIGKEAVAQRDAPQNARAQMRTDGMKNLGHSTLAATRVRKQLNSTLTVCMFDLNSLSS